MGGFFFFCQVHVLKCLAYWWGGAKEKLSPNSRKGARKKVLAISIHRKPVPGSCMPKLSLDLFDAYINDISIYPYYIQFDVYIQVDA